MVDESIAFTCIVKGFMCIIASTHFLEVSSILTSITCLVSYWTMVISMQKWSPQFQQVVVCFGRYSFRNLCPPRGLKWCLLGGGLLCLTLLTLAFDSLSIEISIALPRSRISCSPLSLSLSARRLSWFDLQFCISCDSISLSTSLNLQFFDSLRSYVTNSSND